MKIKTKIIINLPRILHWNRRARVLAKKILKNPGDEKWTGQFRNDWVLKRAKKFKKVFKINLVVTGYENIPKGPAILAANHASSLDAVLMILALENPSKVSTDLNLMPTFVAKDELLDNKNVVGYTDVINTFYVSRKSPRKALQTLNDFGDYIKEEKKYGIIFPEGTRSKDGKIHEFKGGVFRIAKRHFMPIVPVTIINSQGATNSSRKDEITIQVIFGKQIKPLNVMSMDNKRIAAQVQKRVQSKYTEPTEPRDSKYEKVV